MITKQLTKLPREYADAKNQPHVQVAIKMMEQDHIQVQAGMSIQYIVVEGNTSSVAERSMSPKQFLDAQVCSSSVQPDIVHSMHSAPVLMNPALHFRGRRSANLSSVGIGSTRRIVAR
eukprot:SAG11_NODE_802_length_7105_cov_1.831573_7_plen_118_part_00